jgi:hypothetical protein
MDSSHSSFTSTISSLFSSSPRESSKQENSNGDNSSAAGSISAPASSTVRGSASILATFSAYLGVRAEGKEEREKKGGKGRHEKGKQGEKGKQEEKGEQGDITPGTRAAAPASLLDAAETTDGEEVAGWLEKKGTQRNAWKRHWFVVKDGSLSYYVNKGGEKKGGFDLGGARVWVDQRAANPNTFLVSPRAGSLVYEFNAESPTTMLLWIQKIEDVARAMKKDFVSEMAMQNARELAARMHSQTLSKRDFVSETSMDSDEEADGGERFIVDEVLKEVVTEEENEGEKADEKAKAVVKEEVTGRETAVFTHTSSAEATHTREKATVPRVGGQGVGGARGRARGGARLVLSEDKGADEVPVVVVDGSPVCNPLYASSGASSSSSSSSSSGGGDSSSGGGGDSSSDSSNNSKARANSSLQQSPHQSSRTDSTCTADIAGSTRSWDAADAAASAAAPIRLAPHQPHADASDASPDLVVPRTMRGQVGLLLRSTTFVYCTLALSALFFVVTGIQFWSTEYLIRVIKAPYATVLASFAATSATAPVLGVVFGGWIVDRVGGYQGREGVLRTSLIGTVLGVCAVALAIPAGFVTSFSGVILLIWFVLFFGGAIVPGATGLVLSSVPPQVRAFSSAMSILTFNILGYASGTILPGVYMQILKGSSASVGRNDFHDVVDAAGDAGVGAGGAAGGAAGAGWDDTTRGNWTTQEVASSSTAPPTDPHAVYNEERVLQAGFRLVLYWSVFGLLFMALSALSVGKCWSRTGMRRWVRKRLKAAMRVGEGKRGRRKKRKRDKGGQKRRRRRGKKDTVQPPSKLHACSAPSVLGSESSSSFDNNHGEWDESQHGVFNRKDGGGSGGGEEEDRLSGVNEHRPPYGVDVGMVQRGVQTVNEGGDELSQGSCAGTGEIGRKGSGGGIVGKGRRFSGRSGGHADDGEGDGVCIENGDSDIDNDESENEEADDRDDAESEGESDEGGSDEGEREDDVQYEVMQFEVDQEMQLQRTYGIGGLL